MMRKCIVLFAILLLLPVIGLSAQQAGSYTIFQTELGMILDPVGGTGVFNYVGFQYRFNPSLSAGILGFDLNLAGTAITAFLTLKYDVIPQLRLVCGVGHIPVLPLAPGVNVLLGFELIPIRQTLGSGSLEVKLIFNSAIPSDTFDPVYRGGFVLAYGL
jgi:hypothetical protein